MSRPVTLLAAGGTIASTADQRSGATPSLDAAQLAASAGVEVREARSILSLPGPQLRLPDALAIAREVVGAEDGVVLTTGTDTLEELAALIDVMHGADSTVVLTGAIRPATWPGADGPANLVDAVAVAAQAPPGAYVVFAGEIHAAREARKTDSTSPTAFSSPRTGPLGYVAEGHLEWRARPAEGAEGGGRRGPGLDVERLDFAVPIVPTFLGDDGSLFDAALGSDAIVLVALGAGHVPPPVLARLRGADIPVAVTVRPERGALLRAMYGFEGAEGDVRASGAIPAATLSPQAARMRMLAALGAGLRGPELAAAVGDPE